MSRVLVTGCCGFIGSHLCEFLLKKKYFVVGIDNLLTGNIKNIFDFKNDPNFKFIKHDVCNKFSIADKIDYILHFASTASPKDYLKYPIKTLQIGSLGTENMLNLAIEKSSTILVASTSEVYGDPLEHPQKETYFGNVNPVGPRGVYDEAKRYLEALTMAYHKKLNVNTKIVRIFNTYGPRMQLNDGRVVTNFISQAIKGEDITIYGNGNQTRSFCFIDDTVLGIIKAMESDSSEVFNIGNPNEITILQLAEKVISLTNSKSGIKFVQLPEDDPMQRKPDITKANKKLNWFPKVSLEDGLLKTIEWVENSID